MRKCFPGLAVWCLWLSGACAETACPASLDNHTPTGQEVLACIKELEGLKQQLTEPLEAVRIDPPPYNKTEMNKEAGGWQIEEGDKANNDGSVYKTMDNTKGYLFCALTSVRVFSQVYTNSSACEIRNVVGADRIIRITGNANCIVTCFSLGNRQEQK